eukprot:SAG31_NODE_1223_length_9288_cov_8.411253_8_plen_156_part_00
MEDLNSTEYMQKITKILLDNLDAVEARPSIPFNERPPDAPSTFAAGGAAGAAGSTDTNPDERSTLADRDARISYNEFSDSDDDDDDAGYSSGIIPRKQRRGGGRRNQHSFKNSDGDNGLMFLDRSCDSTRSYYIGRRGGVLQTIFRTALKMLCEC